MGTQYANAPSIQDLASEQEPVPLVSSTHYTQSGVVSIIYSDTRRRDRLEAVHDSKLTHIRTDIGNAMNHEILICTPAEFKSHHLPPLPGSYQVAILDAIKKVKWKILSDRPSKSEQTEALTFKSFDDIFKAISALEFSDKERNKYVFRLVPDTTISSDVQGANFRIDACTGMPGDSDDSDDDKTYRPGQSKIHFHITEIIVPMEFKRLRNEVDIRLNRLQIVSAASHIMNDDVRRAFMFAVSIEDHRMSLWYFSRSQCIKSESFDFTDASNLDFLLEVIISLMFATDEELGLDPRVQIHLPQTRSTDEAPKKYIYEFQDGDNRSRFFSTTSCINDFRTIYITGRKTRVFGVIEVENQGTTWREKKGAEPMVLKDVWLDADARTEMEIQRHLFEDIQAFSEKPDWERDPRLKEICTSSPLKEVAETFKEVLKNQNYKDLFLLITAESVGPPSKDVLGTARPPNPPIFLPKCVPGPEDLSQRSSRRQSFFPANPPRNEPDLNQAEPLIFEYRKFAPKKRCFFLFRDECTPISCLPTVGDAYKVLSQCITALRLMCCAGWVHRDVSVGNTLAIQDKNGDWKIKLADLEYAKKFDPNVSGASDPKTGTPSYMAHEILQRAYVKVGQGGNVTVITPEQFTEPDAIATPPVRHNYQHDVESVFWIALWIVTVRVNHKKSMEYGRKIFPRRGGLPTDRHKAFVQPIEKSLAACLHEQLLPLAKTLEIFRQKLHASAELRGEKLGWHDPGSYAFIIGLAGGLLTGVLKSPADWHRVKLAVSNSKNQLLAPDVAATQASIPG
ncbi:hypothetical protein EST38_g14264, partial [Candolleomyces aberdarensis]